MHKNDLPALTDQQLATYLDELTLARDAAEFERSPAGILNADRALSEANAELTSRQQKPKKAKKKQPPAATTMDMFGDDANKQKRD